MRSPVNSINTEERNGAKPTPSFPEIGAGSDFCFYRVALHWLCMAPEKGEGPAGK